MKVCVVGASGVLGRALVPQLLDHGHSVRALARFKKAAQDTFPAEADCRFFDLLSPDAVTDLPRLLKGCNAVIHAATQIPSDFTAPGAWDANNRLRIEGTPRLVQASLAAGISIYIQQSIEMAYIDLGDAWIDESAPFDTSPERSGSSAAVTAMENSVRQIPLNSMRWCILRGGVFVGKGTFQDRAIDRLLAGSDFIAGDGQNFISPIHVEDMASAILASLERGPHGSVFNINATPMRAGDYADVLASSLGVAKPRRDTTQPNPPSYRCSNELAKSTLGWIPVGNIIPQTSR